jgi:prevent-host-death family protein
MTVIDVNAAATKLQGLLDVVMDGEEVVITKDSQPVARLVGLTQHRTKRHFGSARGKVTLADDFDAPLDDFAQYVPPPQSPSE